MLKEKYKRYCPNSTILNLDDADRKRVVEHIERLEKMKKENAIKPPSAEDVERYERWKQGRKKNALSDFTDDERAEIIAAIDIYIDTVGEVEEFFVSGSYTSGSYLDESSTEEDRAIRKPCKDRMKDISDIDIIPVPFKGHKMIGRVDFSGVPKGRRVLVWSHGKIID